MSVRPYLGIARAPFLLLPVTLVAAGTGAAIFEGAPHWGRALIALVGLVSLHAAVNSLNEWSDMRTGIDLETHRTPFSGGSGTLPSGALPSSAALRFGIGGAAVGFAAGVWLTLQIGWVLLPFMALGAVFVLGYTDWLARIGLGEVAAGLGLGGLPVIGTALVQAGTIGNTAIWAAIPATCMTFNLLLLNEFPDEEADRKGGRRNLVLLFGRTGAALVYVIMALIVPAAIAWAVFLGAFPGWSLIATIPSLLLLGPLMWAFMRPGEGVPVPALGANVMWNLVTNTLLAITLGVPKLLA
jgi:1,4-dihydroxy-2-naphthoate polyprenyltransferase